MHVLTSSALVTSTLVRSASPTSTSPSTSPAPPTTQAVPGAHQDPADLIGFVVAVVVIVGAIIVVRWLFRSRRPPRA